MFLISLLRRIRGFVKFSARGMFAERFLNLMARERIPVWDLSRREDALTGCVAAAAYPRLRGLAKKTGVRLRLVGKYGAPFKKKKLMRRRGILAGIAVCILFIAVMSQFIWSIEVNGNEKVSEEDIITAIESIGIKPGIWRPGIKVREMEGRALLLMPEISWIAFNIEGSAIHVEVYETLPVPPVIDPHKPCNVVAGFSGQILEMRVYSGQPVKQKGDAVLAGEVIVSGITQDRRGQNLFRHARAGVIAEVEHEIVVRAPLTRTVYTETGKTARRDYLRIFGLDVPLFLPLRIKRPYRVERSQEPWRLFGTKLPVTHRVERFTLMKETEYTCSETEAREIAAKELLALQNAQLEGGEILRRTLTGKVENGEFVLAAHYICHIDIAEQSEIIVAER